MLNKPLQPNRLGTEPILSLLFKLSIPSIFSMFIQALYNVVDSIFVAKISEDALAALSLAFPIQMVLIAIAVGTGIGTSSLISRSLGQGDEKKASNAAEHVLLVALFYGVLVAMAGIFFSDHLIGLFTNNPILIDDGSRYIKIILVGSTALFIPMIANNILRGEGNTFIPMVTMLIGSILNMILDPIFIFGFGFFPSLGIEGAAYATVASRIISGSFILWMVLNGKNQVKLNLRDFHFDPSIIRGIYKVGLPAMTMQLLASFMIGGLNKILGNYNTTAIAALGIYFKLQSFVFMPVFGLNQGFMPILGYNYGHGNLHRMKETMKLGYITAFVFTSIGFILFQVIPETFIRLFSDSPELLTIGTEALTKISLAFPIIGPAIIGSTIFQALGHGFPSLVLSFSRQIILLLPLALFLVKVYGLSMMWYAFPLSEILSALVMVFWLKSTLEKVFSPMKDPM